jgi:2-polyprenyl-3-methyl-5-hydroxy-6-metoxy-1,4-benzoquinol methylase
MKPLTQCPGCGCARLSAPWRIARQPVILNYRFLSATVAARVARRDLCLTQCMGCGLIFNAAFDSADVPYDSNYENRQCCSPAFQEHLRMVADGLVAKHHLRGGRVLEVGCGKGDFLKLLCMRAQAAGVGYDTSYEGAASISKGRVRFHRCYVAARDIRTPFDAIICRHVVEHIGDIGKFLRKLHDIAAAAGDPVTIIETPAFEWIAKRGCFWDVFYEHCNYFTLPCLAHLCEQAGFRVVRQRLVFGGQYQLLELKVRRSGHGKTRPPGIPVRLATFARKADAKLQQMEIRLCRHGAARGWAIWGAGAKGVALVNRLQRSPPRFVIDSNTAKQGCFVPGSRIPVIAPDDPRIGELELILIANPNYAAEIAFTLRQVGFTHTILTV